MTMQATASRRGPGDAVRFVGALVGFLAIAAGGPLALTLVSRWRFGGWSPVHGVSSVSEWSWSSVRSALLERPSDGSVIDLAVRSGVVVGWLAVAVLVWSVVAEVVHLVRHDGIGLPDVRLLGGPQRLGRVIASGLLVVVPVVGSGRTLALDTVSLVPTTFAASGPTVPVDDEGRSPSSTVPSPESGARSARVPTDQGVHVVVAGESVYSIAQRLTGDDPHATADYAEQILELNLGRTMPDGHTFVNAALIEPGWVLELPAGRSPDTDAEPWTPSDSTSAHTVVPGDSLWSIATEHLGAGERWDEIFDLNEGRTFSDGRSLREPDVIVPGWRLAVPSPDPAVVADEPSDGVVDDVPEEVVDDTGRSSEESSPVDLEPSSTVPSSTVSSSTVPSSTVPSATTVGPASHDAVAIPSSTNSLPDTVPDTVPDMVPDTVADSVPTGPRTAPMATDGTSSDASETTRRNRWLDEPGQPAVELLTVGRAAMVSAGVLALVASRRRRRLRESGPRAVPVRRSEAAMSFERWLRAIDPGDRIVRVDAGVRAAAPVLADGGARVVAVLADTAGGLELVASGPVASPGPWEQGGSAARWVLPATVATDDLAALAHGVGTPCPTMVHIATTEDGRDVLVDLEALGTLEIDAPPDAAGSFLGAIAAALAASPSAETVTLVDVGVGADLFLGHRYHRSASDVADAFRAADAAVAVMPSPSRSTFELRATSPGGESWEPAVVLVGPGVAGPVPPVDRPGVAVVSAVPCDQATARLVAEPGGWRLDPLGIRCTPFGLPPSEARTLVDLVREADAPFDDSTLVPEDDSSRGRTGTPVRTGRPPALLVRLFGPVSVRASDGRVVDFDRQKSKELVVWLATHRERSTRTSARTALWDLDVRDATFANVVSDARRSLARLVPPPDGEEWIGRTLGEDLPLHPDIRTDADLVRDVLAAPGSDRDESAIRALREAVDLIVGPPFEGTDFLWPEVEGIASELVLLATSATTRLAERCLAVGDVDGVFDATARGLQVLPGHEAMVGLRMRAYGSVGDRAGVRREWAQYERVTHADPWSDGEPSAELVGLRRRLLDG